MILKALPAINKDERIELISSLAGKDISVFVNLRMTTPTMINLKFNSGLMANSEFNFFPHSTEVLLETYEDNPFKPEV